MDKIKRKHHEGTVYKAEGMIYWGMVIGLLFLILHFLFLASYWHEEFAWAITFILLPMYSYGIWETFIQATQTSITLYDDGIEWRRGGSRLFSRWDNVSHIGEQGTGRNSRFGIHLHEKVKPEVDGLIEKLVYSQASDFITLTGLLGVPTRWAGLRKGTVVDLDKFAETDFGRDLLYRAPQLFEKGKYKPKHELSDDISREDRIHYENMLSQDIEQVES